LLPTFLGEEGYEEGREGRGETEEGAWGIGERINERRGERKEERGRNVLQ
jgi:hypothetical protein